MTEGVWARKSRSLDARWKLGFALVLVAVAVGGPAPAAPALVATFTLVLTLGVGRPVLRLAIPVLLAAVSGALVTLMHLLLGAGAGGATEALAVGLGLKLFSRMVAGAWVLGLFVFVTPPWKVVAALRGMGLPSALSDVLALSVRYVAVLGEAIRTARDAQLLRGGYADVGRGVRSLAALFGLTLLRAFDQAHATAEAMTARGCEGALHVSTVRGLGS